jgi:hypothetical protein
MNRTPSIALALAAAALSGCGSSKPAASTPAPNATVAAPTTARPAAGSYNPHIDPARFTDQVTNPYNALAPGNVRITQGTKDGVPQTHTTTVAAQTKLIIGVRCRVVHDVVTSNGKLVEKADDWYAQDDKGNVWYFGEATADYEKGVVVSTKGSWEAGIDNAKPGIVMPANPKPGPAFYSEFRPGVAEDRAKVLSLHAHVKVPFGTYNDAAVLRDSNPLDPTLVSHKWYVKGVGLVKTTRVGSSHREFAKLVRLNGRSR